MLVLADVLVDRDTEMDMLRRVVTAKKSVRKPQMCIGEFRRRQW